MTVIVRFTLTSRAQVPSAPTKPRTYFGYLNNEPHKRIFLKGPVSAMVAERAKAIEKWKVEHCAPTPTVRIVNLRMGETGLNTPGLYIMSNALVPDLPVITQPSAELPLVEWGSVPEYRLDFTERGTHSTTEKADYILALFMRYLLGIGDPNDMNFIRARGRVYSVDEESKRLQPSKGGVWGALASATSKTRVQVVRAWFVETHNTVQQQVHQWSFPSGACFDNGGKRRLQNLKALCNRTKGCC